MLQIRYLTTSVSRGATGSNLHASSAKNYQCPGINKNKCCISTPNRKAAMNKGVGRGATVMKGDKRSQTNPMGGRKS